MTTSRKKDLIKFIAMLICVAFIFVLVSYDVFVADHDCAGEGCIVCSLTTGVKSMPALFVCAFSFVASAFAVAHASSRPVVRETLVSRKLKLTI